MNPLLAEFIGTALLVLLGEGVVANVLLNKTKGHDSGLVVIAIGWGIAVFVGVLCTATSSGGHLNPAVTVALALTGKFAWHLVPGYIAAQMAGGMLGATLVWLVYRQHLDATPDGDAKLAVFCTGPAIRSPVFNLVSEVIATFVLAFAVLNMAAPSFGLGAMNALPVALLVVGIGVSLGGTTGYAINPARDLGPRLMHALLPMAGKRDSDWRYAWVPVIGPFIGASLAALLFNVSF